MSRLWYLSRNGQVFGPVTDAQLAESAAAGRILPTDQLNVAGQPHWWPATAVPNLLPAAAPAPAIPAPAEPVVADLAEPEPVPLEAAVEMKTVRITCFACFREVKIEFEAGAQTAHCPKCRAAIQTGEPAADERPPSANQAAFEKLESKKDFKKRMQKKAAAAQQAAANDGAVIGGIIGGIISGG